LRFKKGRSETTGKATSETNDVTTLVNALAILERILSVSHLKPSGRKIKHQTERDLENIVSSGKIDKGVQAVLHLLAGTLANTFENVGAIVESAHGEVIWVTSGPLKGS
jgi:hypothetical protein